MNKVAIGRFFESKVGLMVVGFALTSVFGAFIANIQNRNVWNREKQFELLKQELSQHEALRADISGLMSSRVFRAERMFWALEEPTIPYENEIEREERIEERWEEYYDVVARWNEEYRKHFVRIRHLAGPEVAKGFYSSEKVSKTEEPKTLYGGFVFAHRAIRELQAEPYSFEEEQSEPWTDLHKSAQLSIENLYDEIDDFLLDLYRELDKRARSKNPLTGED